MDIERLMRDLERDEALRLKPYRDSEGILTIGIGRNLEGNGITRAEAFYLCQNDVATAKAALDKFTPWWTTLDTPRQNVLLNMAFNMGIYRLMGFRLMLAALEGGKFDIAANEMMSSIWARQVGPRAERLEKIMRGTS